MYSHLKNLVISTPQNRDSYWHWRWSSMYQFEIQYGWHGCHFENYNIVTT